MRISKLMVAGLAFRQPRRSLTALFTPRTQSQSREFAGTPSLGYGRDLPSVLLGLASRALTGLVRGVLVGTNLPVDEPGVGVGLAAVVAAAALRGETPYRAAPATPPTSIDPAMAAAVIAVRTLFMACLIPPVVFRSSVGTEVGVGGSACRVRRL